MTMLQASRVLRNEWQREFFYWNLKKKCVHSNLTIFSIRQAWDFFPPTALVAGWRVGEPRMINSFLAPFTNEQQVFFFSTVLNVAL